MVVAHRIADRAHSIDIVKKTAPKCIRERGDECFSSRYFLG
jgi:hypothetical protein